MSKVAAWLVPDLIKGSGGHRTILQHAEAMQESGWRVIIYLESTSERRKESPSELVKRLFGYNFDEVYVGWENFVNADAYFATIWYSARIVRDISTKGKKFYFVQDYEAYFNPMGDAYIQAENSYRYGLYAITIGDWLTHKLITEFNSKASSFNFCADTEIYRKLPKGKRDPDALCFVHQPEKPRRCTGVGIEALSIVKYLRPLTKIYLYGSESKCKSKLEHENLGILSLNECNDLYNHCSVGLCISSSNPSRVPFEMMAAGLPVIDIWRENNLYDFSNSSALLCDPTPESIAKGIIHLLDHPEYRASISQQGLKFMFNRPIRNGLEQFMNAVDTAINNSEMRISIPKKIYDKPPLIDTHYEFRLPAELRPSHQRVRSIILRYLPPIAVRALRKGYRLLKETLR